MLTGTLTLTLQTEDDILLAASIIQQRRLAARNQGQGDNADKQMTNPKKGKEQRPTDAAVFDRLRTHFQAKEFSTAQAIEEVKRIAGYSPAKAGRILRKGIETNELTRLREGRYVFTTKKRPSLKNNALNLERCRIACFILTS